MNPCAECVEPALSYAAEALRAARAEPGVSGVSGLALEHARHAHDALRGARAFLELHGPPQYVTYDPAALVRTCQRDLQDDAHLFEIESVTDCVGDPAQVTACLSALIANARLEADAALVVEVYEEEDSPRIVLALDGPGRFPDALALGTGVTLPRDALALRWTAATRGGRLDPTAAGLMLRLRGVRPAPEAVEALVPLLGIVRGAEQRLRLALAGDTDAVDGEIADVLATVERALAEGDGAGRGFEPGNLTAVLNDAADAARDELAGPSISLETYCDPQVPPVRMHRERMRAFFSNVFGYASEILERGGAVAVLVDYDPAECLVGVVVSISGTQRTLQESCRLASMRRAIIQLHGGALELRPDAQGVTFTATVPDPVGRALAEWIPGFPAFS
ncbi:MAG: hypothetical protein JXR94_19965, partial [Candidatus Hydrogenedentes bacterium]|nr:hypothetical protein [Candidatus Hydrogenedentota bacterium]